MDDVDHPKEAQRQAQTQEETAYRDDDDDNSESSDDEPSQKAEPPKEGAMALVSNFDIFGTNPSPRYRGGVYSPTGNAQYMDTLLGVKDPSLPYREEDRFQPEMKYVEFAYMGEMASPKYYEGALSSKLAKLRVLDSSKSADVPLEEKSSNLHIQDSVDRDTNNDSGYSTKVYGSSKGNSPNLCGQLDNDCLGASSLV